jgi:hypothetical protein
MKFIFGILAAFGFVVSANGYEVQMTQGQDSYIFDFPENGRSIAVYQIDENEPPNDNMEGLMHDWFIIEDIYSAMDSLPKNFGLRMGRSVGINNAFAAIRGNWRYIVIDPAWLQGHYARIFVIGHELGHHICGHTAGVMRDSPWDKELEADRFAGTVIRAMEKKGMTTLQEAVGNAMEYLSQFPSATHPPREMRIQAAVEGYNGGSPCIGRSIPNGGIATSGTYNEISASSLWDHNGSVMKLIANASSRKFVYVNPRPVLSAVGIQSGSLLFEGSKIGDSYSGTAYVYSKNCGRVGFEVSGPVATDQRSVTMYGKAPLRSANCQSGGFRDEKLVFVFSGR